MVIVNAAPTVSILWAEETNALTDLIPTISVDDADGDDTLAFEGEEEDAGGVL